MPRAVQSNCRNSFLVSNGRLVTGVGLENIVVVETADAVLVVKKDHTQEIKKLVVDLGDEGHGLAHSHRKVHRPWGWYDSLERGDRFNVKRIVVNPGASLSLQKHCHRAEHWIVVKGIAEVVKGEEKFLLRENESTYIGLEEIHRLKNPGDFPLEIIEVQSGDYLGEDDIIRFDDAYGRAGIF